MSKIYKPQQDFSHYYYKSGEKKLFVKLGLTVQVNDRETLKRVNNPTLDTETTIHFEVDNTDRPTPGSYKGSVLILLKDGINVTGKDIKDQLKRIISDDMRQKGITFYTFHTKVTKPNTTEVGQNTTTISSNGTIEIEE